MIPESERSPGEGVGYPLQYSWASLVVQMVKNPPVMQETWARSLGWEDPLEEGMGTHSSFLPGESHGQGSLVGCSPWGHKELDTTQHTQLGKPQVQLFLMSLLKNHTALGLCCCKG